MATQDRTEVRGREAIDACFTDISEAGQLIRSFFVRNVLSRTIASKPSPDRDLIYGKALVGGEGTAFGLVIYLSDGIPKQISFSEHFDLVTETDSPTTGAYTVNITMIKGKLSAETSGKPLHINEPYGAWVVSRLASLSDVILEYNVAVQPPSA